MDFKLELEKQGRLGKQAARRLAVMASGEKNAALVAMADALQAKQMVILQANAEDVARAEQRGIRPAAPQCLTDRRYGGGVAPSGFFAGSYWRGLGHVASPEWLRNW